MSNGRYAAGTGFGSLVRDWQKSHIRHASGAALGDVGDPTTPGTITGLTLTTYTYRDSRGEDRAHVDATWTPITTPIGEESDPDQAPVTGYLVSHSLDGSKWSGERSVTAPPATFDGLPTSVTVHIRVRAVTSAGYKGPYTTGTITTARDNTPPPQPSTPVLSGVIRGIRIKWDGLSSTGGGQPSDFQRVDIHLANGPGFTATQANKVGEFGKLGGTYTWTDDKAGAYTYYVKLIAYDFAGNASEPSAEASSATQDAIGVNTLIGGGNLLKNSGFDRVSRNASGAITGVQNWITNAVLNSTYFLNATNNRHGSYSLILPAGSYRYFYQDAILPPGDYILTGYVRSTTGATSGGAGVALEVVSGNVTRTSELRYTTEQKDWVRSRVVFKVTSNATVRCIISNSYNSAVDSVGDWFLDSVQLEEGEFSTSWSPQAGELLEGQVTSFDLNDFSIQSADINTGAIISEKIKSGAIIADKIASGEVTTSKLTVTNITNMLADPSFELEDVASGQTGKSWACQSGWKIADLSWARSGKKAAQFTGTTGAISNSGFIPVVRGEFYAASVWLDSRNATAGQGCVRLNFYDKNNAHVITYNGNIVPFGAGFTRSLVTLPAGGVPSNAAYMQYDIAVFNNVGTWVADDCQLRRLNEGELIVDGSVTATKLSAGSISTDKLTVGSVSSESMVANAGFEDATAPGLVADKWYRFSGTRTWMYAEGGANVPSGKRACTVYADSTGHGWMHSATIPVIPGEGYFLSTSVRQVNGNGSVWVGLNLYTDDPGDREYGGYGAGHQMWIVSGGNYNNGIVNQVEGQIYIPAGYRFAKIALLNNAPSAASYAIFDDVALRRVTGSTSIEKGAITTGKIDANAVRANHILAGEISAGHIVTQGLSAAVITSGTLFGLHFRTGHNHERHVSIIDAGDKDAVRWKVPRWDGTQWQSDIGGEIRGALGVNSEINGVYINSNCQIGNTQSTLYQVAKRKMGAGSTLGVRVRGGQKRVFATGGVGNYDLFYDSLSQPPTVAQVSQQYDTESGNTPMIIFVREVYADHLHLMAVYATGPNAGRAPGDGFPLTFNYYVEVGV